MTRSLTLLMALVCAGCITQTEVPPIEPPADMADAGPVDDGGPVLDADLSDPPDAGDQFVPPDIDMGETLWDAAPPPEPEPEPEVGPRWRPAGILDGERPARPLEIVCLDAADVVPPAVISGPGWAYEWRVVEQPPLARTAMAERYADERRPRDSAVQDDRATPQACMFIPLAGDYLTELVVHDTIADEIFPVARMLYTALSGGAVHIEVTWDTPGDVDQTDRHGTDVDLHVRHPNGRNWAQAPLDCYYANSAPDWGPAGPEGNPTLDIDDVNGAGPEQISFDTPEDTNAIGGLYRVGVDYYRADNFASGRSWGPSIVTIRIFFSGELAYEAEREMLATHHFWTVAAIEWIDGVGRVLPIDEYTTQVP